MLPNLLAFDVRVYDPLAPIRADNVEAVDTNGNPNDDAQGTLQPGDPGWEQALTNNYPIVGAGAYVDLFYNRQPYSTASASLFSGAPAYVGPPGAQAAYLNAIGATFDTWALSYERDGIDQLGDGRVDLAANGFDDPDINGNTINGVDDPGERETTPPYPVPLRGIEVRFRAYEPTTRQVRQATIGWDFVTE
jgi:hypothetical protein